MLVCEESGLHSPLVLKAASHFLLWWYFFCIWSYKATMELNPDQAQAWVKVGETQPVRMEKITHNPCGLGSPLFSLSVFLLSKMIKNLYFHWTLWRPWRGCLKVKLAVCGLLSVSGCWILGIPCFSLNKRCNNTCLITNRIIWTRKH